MNKDDEDINQKDKIIMSLESLHKISELKRYEMVVCDEMETLLSNFSSSTLGARTYETFQRFENLLKGAKKVVMMDAFISNRTIHLAKGDHQKKKHSIFEECRRKKTCRSEGDEL